MPHRILIIDDERPITDLLAIVLRREGFERATAVSSEGSVTVSADALAAVARQGALAAGSRPGWERDPRVPQPRRRPARLLARRTCALPPATRQNRPVQRLHVVRGVGRTRPHVGPRRGGRAQRELARPSERRGLAHAPRSGGRRLLALGATVVVVMALLFGRSFARPLLHMMDWLSLARHAHHRTPLRRARLEAAREEWTSGVSHDLKTPLSSVRGYADLLASDYDFTPEEVRAHAKGHGDGLPPVRPLLPRYVHR